MCTGTRFICGWRVTKRDMTIIYYAVCTECVETTPCASVRRVRVCWGVACVCRGEGAPVLSLSAFHCAIFLFNFRFSLIGWWVQNTKKTQALLHGEGCDRCQPEQSEK